MPYELQTWVDKDAAHPLSAARMNHLDAGVLYASIFLNVKEAPFSAKGDGTTNDTSAIQAALTLAGVGGEEAVVYIPLGVYVITAALKVPANVRIVGASMRGTRLIAKGNIDLFRLEAGDNLIENLYVEAETKQTSGSAFDFSHGFTANARLEHIMLGHNFFNGFYVVGSGALIGAIHFSHIHFVAFNAAVKGYGNAAFVIGSTACRVAVVTLEEIHGQANENKDMPKWLEVNNTDSLLGTNLQLQNQVEGIVVGNNDLSELQTTGMKITNAWIDSVPTEPSTFAYKLQKLRDATFTACNAQNCTEGAYIGLECLQVKFNGGTFQSNRRQAFRIASTVGSCTLTGGLTITDNNAEAAAGAGEGAGVLIEAGASNVFITGVSIGNFMAQGAKQRYAIFIQKGKSKNVFVTGNVLPEKGTKPATGAIRENTVKAVVNEAEGTEAENNVRIGASPVNAYS